MNQGENILRLPDDVRVDGKESLKKENGVYTGEDLAVTPELRGDVLSVSLTSSDVPVKDIALIWKGLTYGAGQLLSDTWERAYGELCFREKNDSDVMPWYFLDDRGNNVYGFGVKVRPGAMCYWKTEGDDLVLHLDVRNGSEGTVLKDRVLKAADVIMREYKGQDAFDAAHALCVSMCDDPIFPEKPLYGGNNWYYAYGVSSREEILRDSKYLRDMTEGNKNRPFMVIDDGWQIAHTEVYNGGPWNDGNSDYGDMGRLASDMKKLNVRPGIWFRPLFDTSEDLPSEWRLMRDERVLDISVPEVVSLVQEDIRRIRGWGFELIKHDFSTFDIFGIWGYEMQSELTKTRWSFRDASRTTAEIIVDFYRAIREAAQDVLILGCNCIGHLGAGLMEANRTGDDTSGLEWERTRKMGVNTLAFRMPQHGAFYGADADCVGITDKVPWEKNRQWMEILSLSGTPFFVSVRPGTLSPEKEEELKKAYKAASQNTIPAVPLDWKKGKLPAEWNTFDGIKKYNW